MYTRNYNAIIIWHVFSLVDDVAKENCIFAVKSPTEIGNYSNAIQLFLRYSIDKMYINEDIFHGKPDFCLASSVSFE
jgi:hypothetical protein